MNRVWCKGQKHTMPASAHPSLVMHVPLRHAPAFTSVPNSQNVAHHGNVVAHIPGPAGESEEDRGPQDPDVPGLPSRCECGQLHHHRHGCCG